MNPRDSAKYNILANELSAINTRVCPLPGINNSKSRDSFIKQLIDSIRRIEFINRINSRNISADRCDPLNINFDPIRAAILKKRQGDIDEAVWLIFLAIHFGKHLKHGWLMMRDIYGGLDENNHWTWSRICNNKPDFDDWFTANHKSIQGAFGNHRKYESIRPNASRNLIDITSSYIEWVGENNSHADIINNVSDVCNGDPEQMFDHLYNSSNHIISFGRTARFDFLTMIAKIGIIDIAPAYAYIKNATGPLRGAKLLLTGNRRTEIEIPTLEDKLKSINNRLTIGPMGMQVLEDSLCNWQKTPNTYKRFRG